VLEALLREEFGLTVVEDGTDLISPFLSSDQGVQGRSASCVLHS
jgi:hypothetical protein